MGITILALRVDLPYVALRRRAVFAIGALLITAIYLGRTKLAFQMAGGGWFQEGCYQKSFDDPFFGHTTSCQALPEALEEADRVLAANPNARIFFGPSPEFLRCQEAAVSLASSELVGPRNFLSLEEGRPYL